MLAIAPEAILAKFEESAPFADRCSGRAFSPGAGRGKSLGRLPFGAGCAEWARLLIVRAPRHKSVYSCPASWTAYNTFQFAGNPPFVPHASVLIRQQGDDARRSCFGVSYGRYDPGTSQSPVLGAVPFHNFPACAYISRHHRQTACESFEQHQWKGFADGCQNQQTQTRQYVTDSFETPGNVLFLPVPVPESDFCIPPRIPCPLLPDRSAIPRLRAIESQPCAWHG